MFGLSPLEILVVGALIVLLFGTRRLPELGKGMGEAIRNFRKAYGDSDVIDVTPKKDEAPPDQDKKV